MAKGGKGEVKKRDEGRGTPFSLCVCVHTCVYLKSQAYLRNGHQHSLTLVINTLAQHIVRTAIPMCLEVQHN